jgi:hypothetical protein
MKIDVEIQKQHNTEYENRNYQHYYYYEYILIFPGLYLNHYRAKIIFIMQNRIFLAEAGTGPGPGLFTYLKPVFHSPRASVYPYPENWELHYLM